MEFFRDFPTVVAPLNALGVLLALPLVGALGGATIARLERRSIGIWAVRSGMLFSVASMLGALVSSLFRAGPGAALPGLVVGGLIGCVGVVLTVRYFEE